MEIQQEPQQKTNFYMETEVSETPVTIDAGHFDFKEHAAKWILKISEGRCVTRAAMLESFKM